MSQRLTAAWDRLIDGLAMFGGILIAGVCLLIAWDVIARNLGIQPPASTVAFTEYCLLWFTMASAPWLVRERGHIVVEVVYRRLAETPRKIMDRLIPGFCALISLAVAVIAAVLALEAWQRGEIEVRSLDAPRWLLFLPMAVGFLLMACEFLRLLINGDSVVRASGQKESV